MTRTIQPGIIDNLKAEVISDLVPEGKKETTKKPKAKSEEYLKEIRNTLQDINKDTLNREIKQQLSFIKERVETITAQISSLRRVSILGFSIITIMFLIVIGLSN